MALESLTTEFMKAQLAALPRQGNIGIVGVMYIQGSLIEIRRVSFTTRGPFESLQFTSWQILKIKYNVYIA